MTKKKQVEELPTFEVSIGKLESIISMIEQDNTSLEESLRLFEEGINLTRQVQTGLSEAEQKVRKLIETDAGVASESFTPQEN